MMYYHDFVKSSNYNCNLIHQHWKERDAVKTHVWKESDSTSSHTRISSIKFYEWRELWKHMGEILASAYHDSGVWYREAELPKHDWSISVLMTPGLSATMASPGGNSLAADLVKPSTAHFEAQYGAT